MITPVGGSASDTTPPSTPSGLTATPVSGTQITLSWPAATDNVGVTGYQVERCQGAGCTTFALLASPTTTSYGDTGLSPSTSYSYRVRARDAVGNLSGYSIIMTAITGGGGPVAGLVAAYGLNEGTGLTTSDASGNNNTGTIGAATWTTQGKFGNALSFNGTSAMVTVPDAPSLDLTTGMTLEAWAYPTVTGGGEVPTLVMKQNSPGTSPSHVYVLHGRAWVSDTGPLLPGTRINTGTSSVVSGGNLLAANTWTHVAATWDGAVMRVYLNGVQVASGAAIGSLINSSGQVSIGGNVIYPVEFFKGLLDEIRIYNRALSASEIQQDMITPVGGP